MAKQNKKMAKKSKIIKKTESIETKIQRCHVGRQIGEYTSA